MLAMLRLNLMLRVTCNGWSRGFGRVAVRRLRRLSLLSLVIVYMLT